MAGAAPLGYSSGGMVTKLQAAKIATASGCRMAIADGRDLHPLQAARRRRRLHLVPRQRRRRLTARKTWIAGVLNPVGAITVDQGAERALQSGRSLLPVGVRAVTGRFERGDAVSILTLGRAGDRQGAFRLFQRGRRAASPATIAVKSRRYLAIVGATK